MTLVVTVVGARGGAGASTVAALLARRLARRRGAVALVDLDHAGGGVDVLLGTEGEGGARWADLAHLREPLEPDELDGALPLWRGVEVLGHDRRTVGPVPATVRDAVWPALVGRCRAVVLDVPGRCLAALPPTASRGPRVDVTTQDVCGAAAALAVVAVLGAPADHLVLRRRRGARVAPAELGHVAGGRGVVSVPDVRGLRSAVDEGLGPVVGARSALQRAVVRVAEHVDA